MKYLLLIYNDDTLLDALPAGEFDTLSRDRTDPTAQLSGSAFVAHPVRAGW